MFITILLALYYQVLFCSFSTADERSIPELLPKERILSMKVYSKTFDLVLLGSSPPSMFLYDRSLCLIPRVSWCLRNCQCTFWFSFLVLGLCQLPERRSIVRGTLALAITLLFIFFDDCATVWFRAVMGFCSSLVSLKLRFKLKFGKVVFWSPSIVFSKGLSSQIKSIQTNSI